MTTAPLDGLRILELATWVAGPYAGRLLAMLGASGVKREPKGGGPVLRQSVDFAVRKGTSPLVVHLNAGKRPVSGLPLEKALPWADVVPESRVAHELADTPAAPEALAGNRPVLNTSSRWGQASSRPGRVLDELLVPEPERLRQFYLDVGRGQKPWPCTGRCPVSGSCRRSVGARRDCRSVGRWRRPARPEPQTGSPAQAAPAL